MIQRLLAFSIRQRALVLILSLVFVIVGAVAASGVAIDAVPDVTNVQVQVISAAPALGPTDVETYVTYPVETAMAGLPGVEEIRSISRPGISVVTVVFRDDIDLYFARQIVGERLSQTRDSIPPEYATPQLGPVSTGLGEIFHFTVSGDAPLMERRSVLDWQIAPRLRMVPGVVEVNTFGGEAETLEVEIDPQRLAANKVDVHDVVQAIQRNHVAVGGAYIVDGREHVTVRGEARVRSLEDMGLIVVALRDGRTPVLLRDLGKLHKAPRVRYGAVSHDGQGETVVGVAMLLMGENAGQVVGRIREALEDISHSLPPGITVEPYYDRTELVHKTIHTVSTNLLEASVLVIGVLFLTLANLRAGLLVMLSIPLALLGVFIGMRIGGVSGNLLSLGAIDFGLVVDGAIIIVENAQRHLAEKRASLNRVLTDGERREVVLEAATEVRGATAFGEAIIALVYIPILALEGVEGRMFRPMAFTVLFALGTAFILSLTLVPALASLMLSRDGKDHPSRFVSWVLRAYKPALAATLSHPRLTVSIATVVFAISIISASFMGREFLPKLDEGSMVITMVRLPSVSLDQALDHTHAVEKTLQQFPEVTKVVCRTGRAEIAIDPMSVNMTDVYVMLRPRKEWKTAHDREGLIEAFDKQLTQSVPGAGFSYTQPIEMNTNDLLAGIESDLALHIYGNDLGVLRKVGDQMVGVLREIPGAADVRAEQVAGLNVLTTEIDRSAIARLGLDASSVLETVAALGGLEAGTVVEGNRRIPIQVRLNPEARSSAESIASLPIRVPSGALVPLGQLARFDSGPGPSQVSRERLQRRITVQLNIRGRDIGSYVDQARGEISSKVKLPTGYYVAWAGEYEKLQSATARLLVVVPIALALIAVLLIATFGALRPAALIFLNVPMSITGGVAALMLRGMPFSISAGVGFIALFGVAVLNGLVLLSAIERARHDGAPLDDAVRSAAHTRLRPVLTTALVASLGFIPMALATGSGAEVQRPLATVVIGGILSSTLLTLLVLPAAYGLAYRLRSRVSRDVEPPPGPANA